MFETTTTDSGTTVVNVSFWQCAKAGLAFSLGALLLVPFLGACWLLLQGSLGALMMMFSLRR